MTPLLKKIFGQIQIAQMVFVLNILFNISLFIFVPYIIEDTQAHKIIWIICILSWFFYLLFYFVLRINYSIPLKRLANNIKLVASGQRYIPYQSQIRTEFRSVYLQFNKLSKKIQWLLNENRQLELSYQKTLSDKSYAEMQVQKQQDTTHILLNIAALINRISDPEQIWNRIAPDLIENLEYDICLIFRMKEQQLNFFDLGFKGLITTTERLKEQMRGYILPRENAEYELLGKQGVLGIKQPHFNFLLEKMHLKVNFMVFSVEEKSLVFAGHIQTGLAHSSDNGELLEVYAELVQSVFKRFGKKKQNTTDENVYTHVLNATNSLLTRFVNNDKEFNKKIGHDFLAPIRNIEGLLSSVYRKYSQDLNDDIKNRLQRIESNVNKERELLEGLRLSEIKGTDEKLDFMELLQSVQNQLSNTCFRVNVKQPISQFRGRPKPIQAALLLLFYNFNIWCLKNDTLDINISAIEDGNQIEIRCSVRTPSEYLTKSGIVEALNLDLCNNLVYSGGGDLKLHTNTIGSVDLFLNFKLGKK